MEQEKAMRIFYALWELGGEMRLVHHITAIVLYKADPELWNKWLESLDQIDPRLDAIQASADQNAASFREMISI